MRRLFTLLALVFAFGAAGAAEPDMVPAVEVHTLRSRLLPYKDVFYPVAKALQQALAGRVALAVQLRPTRQAVAADNIQVWLEGQHEALELAPQPNGLFVVPVSDRIAADEGHLLINRRSEDVSVNMVLLPTLARDAWTIGAMRRLLDDARGAAGKLLPWYQKPMMWAVTRRLAVSVCSRMRDVPVQLLDGERVVATVHTRDESRNYAQETVFCHRFSGGEGYPEGTRVVVPEDGEVLLM